MVESAAVPVRGPGFDRRILRKVAGPAGLVAVVLALVMAVRGGLIAHGSPIYDVLVDPFVLMVDAPDLLVQTLWEGLVSGVLYALIALGFVLIFKASGVFNFAQGIMVVFAALTLIGLYTMLRRWGVAPGDLAAFLALFITIGVMFVLAFGVERLMLRPLVNQPDIILF